MGRRVAAPPLQFRRDRLGSRAVERPCSCLRGGFAESGQEGRPRSAPEQFCCEYVRLSGSVDIFSEAHSRVSRQCILVPISYVYCLDPVVPHIELEIEPAPEGIPMSSVGRLYRP